MTSSSLEGLLLSWLVTYAVHSTLLLGAVWLLFSRTSIGSLRAREVVWKTALLGGIVTAGLQATIAPDPVGGRWTLPGLSTPPVTDVAVVVEEPLPMRALPPAQFTHSFTEVDAPVPQTTSVYDAFSGTNGAGATSPLTEPAILSSADVGRWSLIAWAIIGGTCLLAMAVSWRRLGRFLAGKRRIHEGPLPGLLSMLRREGDVSRHVRLYTCPGLSSPLAMGSLFPKICLPERIHDIPREMQESILAHELAHVARFDPLWLIVARSIELVFFFQPLNRVARRNIQQSAELLCDDWAIERTARPIVLARSLAEVAGWLMGEPPKLACAMVAQNSALGDRVSRLLNERRPETRSPWTLPSAALLLAGTVMLAPGFADQNRAAERDAGIDSATLRRDLKAVPAKVTRGDEDRPFGVEGVSGTLTQLGLEIAAELEELTRSIAVLRARGEANQVSESLAARIEALDLRSQELRVRKERMEQLIGHWQSAAALRVQAALETSETSQ